MIIKLMKDQSDYWMCDGVDSIDVSVIREAKGEEHPQPEPNISKVVASYFEKGNAGDKGMAIHFLNKLGEKCVILFNTIAYICNDEGKTVDTIYG